MAFAILGALITGGLTYAFTQSVLFALLMGGLSLVANLLTPRPKTLQPKPASLADFSVTQANEGQPLPIVYGRVKIPGTIIYYGALETKPETETVKGGKGGKKNEQTVIKGYHYYIDMWQAICEGPIVLESMFIDNDPNKAVNYNYYIFNNGEDTVYPTTGDNPDLVFSSRLPGVAHIFFKRFHVGLNRTNVPVVYYWVRRILNTPLPYNDIVYGDTYYGNNPAGVIYDLLVNYGEIDSSYIDTTSFTEAANYFYTKRYGINYVISSTREIREIIEELCNALNITLVYTQEGKIAIKFLPKNTNLIIQDDFISFQLTKQSWNTLPNLFKANIVHDGTPRTLIIENQAPRIMSGKTITKTYDLTFFSQYDVALEYLSQLVKKESIPRSILHITVPLKYAFLEVGDVIGIVNTEIDMIGCFKIIQITEPKLDSNELEIIAITHEEAKIDTNVLVTEGGSHYTPPTFETTPFTKIKIVELDYIDDLVLEYLFLVSKETGLETDFAVFVSPTGDEYTLLDVSSHFALAGELVEPYPADTYDIDDEIGIVFKPYNEFMTFDNISRNSLFNIQRVAVIGNEIMTFQQYIPVGSNEYQLKGIIRGLYWTRKESYPAGTPIFIGVMSTNVIPIDFTGPFYVKIVPVINGQLGSLEDATPILINPTLKVGKPLEPQRILATRTGSTVNVDVFVITKTLYTGAGKINADAYTDTYPFEYEGKILVSINGGPFEEYSTPNFTITNPSAFTLTVKTKWNGFVSDPLSLSVGSSDGEYIAQANF